MFQQQARRNFFLCWGGFLLFLIGYFSSCHKAPSPLDASTYPDVSPERCFAGKAGSPRIIDMSLAGFLPHHPQTLRFLIKWEDNNANLKGGRYQFTVNGVTRSILSLPEARVSASSDGELELTLSLLDKEVNGQTQIRIELVMWDADGLASNRPLLVLEAKQ